MDAGLNVPDGDSDVDLPMLAVTVTSVTEPDGCAAAVSIELAAPALGAMKALQADRLPGGLLSLLDSTAPRTVGVSLVMASLVDRAFILTGRQAGFYARVTDQIKRATVEIATEIRLANQKKPLR